jgi:hypothetical protein
MKKLGRILENGIPKSRSPPNHDQRKHPKGMAFGREELGHLAGAKK